MKVEAVEFKRCCDGCVPLRYGILFWGYLRLVFSVIFFVVITLAMIAYAQLLKHRQYMISMEQFVVFGIIMGLLLVDISFNATLIAGGHQKSARLLRIYFVYCIVLLTLESIGLLLSSSLEIFIETRNMSLSSMSPELMSFIVKSELASGILSMATQLYFIFLLRSEIKKLKGNCQFRFVNNANESHCVLEVEAERGVDGVSGTAGEGDETGGPGDGTQGDAGEGEGGTARRHGEYTRFQ